MGKHTYSNDQITVGWDSETCFHSKVCVNNLASVFNLQKKPWINVDGDSKEAIMKLIDTCPSGALSYKLANQHSIMNQESKPEVSITIASSGPYLIKGNVEVLDAEGNLIETRENFALCRCGNSSNKPFCDGSHKKIDFQG